MRARASQKRDKGHWLFGLEEGRAEECLVQQARKREGEGVGKYV